MLATSGFSLSGVSALGQRHGRARGKGEREREREGLVRGSTCVWRVLAAKWERNGGAMTRENGGERGLA